jgi:hypothetical protein
MKADSLRFNLIVIVLFKIQSAGVQSQKSKSCHCPNTFGAHHIYIPVSGLEANFLQFYPFCYVFLYCVYKYCILDIAHSNISTTVHGMLVTLFIHTKYV